MVGKGCADETMNEHTPQRVLIACPTKAADDGIQKTILNVLKLEL